MKNTLAIYFNSLLLPIYYFHVAAEGFDLHHYEFWREVNTSLICMYFALIHFVICSWLYLYYPKQGSILGAITAIGMFVFPMLSILYNNFNGFSLSGGLVYLLILLLNVFLIFIFIAFGKKPETVSLKLKLGLTLIPLIFILRLIVIGTRNNY